MDISDQFDRLAQWASEQAGRPAAFAAALSMILLWAASGFVFRFSDTWQLVINTGTTIVTFLMVFLLQNTQARDTAALHLKLDELIASSDRTSKAVIGAEELPRQVREAMRKGERAQ